MSTLGDYYGDELVSQLASTITKSSYESGGQGLGIAMQLYEQMKRNYSTVETVDKVQSIGTSDNTTL